MLCPPHEGGQDGWRCLAWDRCFLCRAAPRLILLWLISPAHSSFLLFSSLGRHGSSLEIELYRASLPKVLVLAFTLRFPGRSVLDGVHPAPALAISVVPHGIHRVILVLDLHRMRRPPWWCVKRLQEDPLPHMQRDVYLLPRELQRDVTIAANPKEESSPPFLTSAGMLSNLVHVPRGRVCPLRVLALCIVPPLRRYMDMYIIPLRNLWGPDGVDDNRTRGALKWWSRPR